MNVFGILGIPDCAVQGCPNPGIVKVEVEGRNGKIWAYLCVLCMSEIGECLGHLSTAAHEKLPMLPAEQGLDRVE